MLAEINVNACFTSERTMLLLLCTVVNLGVGEPLLGNRSQLSREIKPIYLSQHFVFPRCLSTPIDHSFRSKLIHFTI